MATPRITTERLEPPEFEEAEFPEISEEDKRALIESLEEAERQIARGDYVTFDPDAFLSELKKKYSTLK